MSTYSFRKIKAKFIGSAISGLVVLSSFAASAQTVDKHGKNNPFSPSPSTKSQGAAAVPQPTASTATFKVLPSIERPTPTRQENLVVARQTMEIVKKPSPRTLSPAEIYRVGIGDVLYVDLLNAPKASGYFTIRQNGSIDFPLAGDNVIISGLSVDEISDALTSGIKLYTNPRVEVKVREYASHKISVSGMVERPGEKMLQREAIPLYIIKAEAIVDASATRVVIKRNGAAKSDTYDMGDPKTENILVSTGDNIEFTVPGRISGTPSRGQFYYIGGDIVTKGQREFYPGMTLSQAVLAAGGSSGNSKKAIIRRKNEKGILTTAEHNLKAIRDGKAPDPELVAGDMIEIGK